MNMNTYTIALFCLYCNNLNCCNMLKQNYICCDTFRDRLSCIMLPYRPPLFLYYAFQHLLYIVLHLNLKCLICSKLFKYIYFHALKKSLYVAKYIICDFGHKFLFNKWKSRCNFQNIAHFFTIRLPVFIKRFLFPVSHSVAQGRLCLLVLSDFALAYAITFFMYMLCQWLMLLCNKIIQETI